MKSLTVIVLSSVLLCTTVFAIRDGDIYRLTSAKDGKVLTVKSSELEVGSAITLENWQDQTNQKWLAVEAVVAGDNYLLIPKRQQWDWNRWKSRGDGHLRDRHGNIPDWTLVLSQDTKSGSHGVSQQYRDSKPNQQWRTVRVEGTNKHLIKNVASGLCIKNPGDAEHKKPGLFQRVKEATHALSGSQKQHKSKIPEAKMTTCLAEDQDQQWTLDLES